MIRSPGQDKRTQARDTFHVLPLAAGMTPAAFFMQARKPQPMTVHANDEAVDRLKIDVRDAWELRWWCRQFGCTETQLRAAIEAIGAIAGNVRKHLLLEQARR